MAEPNVENKFREAERFPGAQFSHVSGHQIPTDATVEAAKEALKEKDGDAGVKQFAQAVIDLREYVDKEHPELVTDDRK